MKRALAALVVASALVLTGCSVPDAHTESPTQADDNAGMLYEAKKTLSDGRVVTCLISMYNGKTDLSCDWAGATR